MAPSLLARIATAVKPAVPVFKSYTEIYIAFAITGYLIWKIPITGSVFLLFLSHYAQSMLLSTFFVTRYI